MTMEFINVKNAVKQILVDAAANRYQVIGFQRQEKAATEFTGVKRLVEVYFKNENFNKASSSLGGPISGKVDIAIELTVSAPAKADLNVLLNEGSTAAELEAALLAMKEASNVADDSFDLLAEIIYQILMDAKNLDLQMPIGQATDRWVASINKNDPNPRGELVVLTGFVSFSCTVSEDVPGDASVPIDTNDIVTEINNDTVQKTGVTI